MMKKLTQQYIDHAVSSALSGFPTELTIRHGEPAFDSIVIPLVREALTREVKVMMVSPLFRQVSFYKERARAWLGDVVSDSSRIEILSTANPALVDAVKQNDVEKIKTTPHDNPSVADNLESQQSIMILALDAQSIESNLLASLHERNPDYMLILRRYL